MELSQQQIKTALTFAAQCSQSTFDRVFQYKIVTRILPTNEYLKRYRVKESDRCDLCGIESDTIDHRLYECYIVAQKIDQIVRFLKSYCKLSTDIGMVNFLFGIEGTKHIALNHIFLELKKSLFYSKLAELSSPHFNELFFQRIRILMIKEKLISAQRNSYDLFDQKWKNFTKIYDYRGPDINIVK